jgi:transposase
MKSKTFICGIDVSKSSLDICFNDQANKLHHLRVGNDASGHALIISKLGIMRTYVMESTGPYYLRLAFKLKKMGADVRVENPIVIKRFIQMNMERNKSDKKDAGWIYRYALEREAAQWDLPSKEQFHCSQMLGAIDLYKRQLTMLSNQMHSIEQLPLPCREVRKSLEQAQLKLQKEVIKLENQLEEMLNAWQGKQQHDLSTIPGLGKRAVAILIVYTEGFKKIRNHRQLIALAGLAPREHISGSSIRGKKGICKMGNGYLRNVLYMCSLSAIKYNKACKELYERLKAAGKKGKVALIAVCNKLLKQAFAIATKGTEYQEDFKSSLLKNKLVF